MAFESDSDSEYSPVRKKEPTKFTWRISQFSRRKESRLHSDNFLFGGHSWRIILYPKGCSGPSGKYLSVGLEFFDSGTMPDGLTVKTFSTLTLIDQTDPSESELKSGTFDFSRWRPILLYPSFLHLQDFKECDYGYIIDDTVIIEAEVSFEVGTSKAAAPGEPKVTEANQPRKATRPSLTKPFPLPTQKVQASSPFSPSIAQSTSRKLIAELSTVTTNCNPLSSDGTSSSNAVLGSGVTQQQREKLVEFLSMSLEDICQTKLLDEVERIALEAVEHSTDPVEKTVLKALVSRLAEFKVVVPSSLSTIETGPGLESSISQMAKEMEARLVHRKRKLSCLEEEVSRLGEEGMKLEAEIQQLSAHKAKLIDKRNSTVFELEKANKEASKELEEFKQQCDQNKQAIESSLKAKERVAQANASWKLFKDNLGW